MAAIEPDWPALLCFSLLWTICCVVFFMLADLVPVRGRLATDATRVEFRLIVANFTLLLGLFLSSLVYGAFQLKITSVIVALGLIFLFSPALLRFVPPVGAYPRSGPITLMIIQACLLCLLWTGKIFPLPGEG